jgi:hypothetical protein
MALRTISIYMRRRRFTSVAQRQQLLAAAREFRTNPNNKSVARLLVKVAKQFDREPYVKRGILTEADRLTKDPELIQRIGGVNVRL